MSEATSERRKPTGQEWTGIVLVTLLFTLNSLGMIALHYVFSRTDADYAALVEDGLGPFDSDSYYGIHRLVPLATAVLTVLRHRWAVVTAWLWVGWLVLGIVRGVVSVGVEAIPFLHDDPAIVIANAFIYGCFIVAAWYLVVLRRRGLLR